MRFFELGGAFFDPARQFGFVLLQRFSPAFGLFVGALPLDHAAELQADLRHEIEQRLIGFARVGREKFEHRDDFVAR